MLFKIRLVFELAIFHNERPSADSFAVARLDQHFITETWYGAGRDPFNHEYRPCLDEARPIIEDDTPSSEYTHRLRSVSFH